MSRLWSTSPGFAAAEISEGLLRMQSAAGDTVRPMDAEFSALDSEFSALYEQTFPRVYAFVRSQVSSAETAQDLVSQIFLKTYRHWHAAPRGEAATFWLFRIARNALIDHWRVEGKRESVSVPLDELVETRGQEANPEAICSARERSGRLLEVVGSLDKGDRVVLALKFTAQHTNREVAAILNISEAAVSMRLLRALRRLRDRLAERGVS